MKLQAALFDLDDTLYGSFSECDAYAYQKIGEFAEQTFSMDGAAFVRAFAASRARLARSQPGMPPIHDRVLVAQGALEALGLSAATFARRVHAVYWQAVFDKMKLRDGVAELLSDLHAANIPVGVCTDMLADIQFEKLERLGIAEDVTYLISSEEAGSDKPAPAIFRLALSKCRCRPENAVMVGDNFRHDIQGALDCGISGIWLNWNNQTHPPEDRAFEEAHTFAEAANLIRRLL